MKLASVNGLPCCDGKEQKSRGLMAHAAGWYVSHAAGLRVYY